MEPKFPEVKIPKTRKEFETQIDAVIERELPKYKIDPNKPEINIPEIREKILPKVAKDIESYAQEKLKTAAKKPDMKVPDIAKEVMARIEATVEKELEKMPELKVEPKAPEVKLPEKEGEVIKLPVVEEYDKYGEPIRKKVKVPKEVNEYIDEKIPDENNVDEMVWHKELPDGNVVYIEGWCNDCLTGYESATYDEKVDIAINKTPGALKDKAKEEGWELIEGGFKLAGDDYDNIYGFSWGIYKKQKEVEPKPPEVKVPEKEEVKPAKEYWQMTRKEISKLGIQKGEEQYQKQLEDWNNLSDAEKMKQDSLKPTEGWIVSSTENDYLQYHKTQVAQALKEGKPVPDEVLKRISGIEGNTKDKTKIPGCQGKT